MLYKAVHVIPELKPSPYHAKAFVTLILEKENKFVLVTWT